MTSYQDLFNSLLNVTADSQSATAFPETQGALSSITVDTWLADELYKSGIIQQMNPLNLPQSPPVSPPDSIVSNSDSISYTYSPINRTPLFPDITSELPLMVDQGMLKQPNILPRIAPRPASSNSSSTSFIPLPSTPHRRPHTERNMLDQDEIALKRQKNTITARKSRLKKVIKMEGLEKEVSDLELKNRSLTTRIAVLESEKIGLSEKDSSLEERIQLLETQLAEAHKALTKS